MKTSPQLNKSLRLRPMPLPIDQKTGTDIGLTRIVHNFLLKKGGSQKF